MSSDRLFLFLFGPFEIAKANTGKKRKTPTRLYLKRRQARALLAFLAIFRQSSGHSREKIAGLFWGDVPDAQARHSLRTALLEIRQQLGEDWILSDRETIQLNPDVPLWVDALEFVHLCSPHATSTDLEAGVKLYRGELLPDFYDDWVLRERERYRNLYLDALLRLVQNMRSQSEYGRAIQFAHKVLAIDAANERAYQHLMFSYLAVGNRDGALKQYEACEVALRQELEVAPSPETNALGRWIRETHLESGAPEALITNLPIPLSSFIGRNRETSELKERLSRTRLLTLTGAGGSGKTRLAIQVATDLVDAFKDGAWWVDLAALTDPELVVAAVAKTFGIRETSDRALAERLADLLRTKQLLLVLDNCEHLVGASSQLSEKLLSACPHLRILATSREAFGIAGEMVYPVPTLALPQAQALPSVEMLMQYEGVRLFVERARAVQADLSITAENAPKIVEICQRLDGIPLAIELAAARAKVLSVEQIAERLAGRLSLLTIGSRNAPPRQQTLRATIDWSYGLLSEEERTLFRRLAVFVGGWAYEAVEGVGQTEPPRVNSLDVLSRLVDKSLVLKAERGNTTRYGMLETIREYALEKLQESGEADAVHKRRLDFLLGMAREADAQLTGAKQIQWLDRLEVELDNIRSALTWSLERDQAAEGLELAGSLWRYWLMHGHLSEGRQWLEAALTRAGSLRRTVSAARALDSAGALAWLQADYSVARAQLEEARAICTAQADVGNLGYALTWLGMVLPDQGQVAEGRACAEQAGELFRETGDKWGFAHSLFVLGRSLRLSGDTQLARAYCENSVRLFRELGDRWGVALSVGQLGVIAEQEGDYAAARSLLSERLTLAREFGSRHLVAFALYYLGRAAYHCSAYDEAVARWKECLEVSRLIGQKDTTLSAIEGLGWIAGMNGQPKQAARLLGAAEGLRHANRIPRDVVDQAEYGRNLALLRGGIDLSAWAEASTMSFEQAVEYALNS